MDKPTLSVQVAECGCMYIQPGFKVYDCSTDEFGFWLVNPLPLNVTELASPEQAEGVNKAIKRAFSESKRFRLIRSALAGH